ncbi:MAG: sugar phosphate isomerase/epimerase [Clostridia bacterium]|nr:sugar phosphate isomerase/epimerase [Clostridia bacterium]
MANRLTSVSVNNTLNAEDYAALHSAGIDCVEISMLDYMYDTLDINEVVRLASGAGVRVRSFHLRFYPFSNIDISNTDEEKRVCAVEYQKSFIKKVSEAGVHIFVIHPSGEPISDEDRPARINAAKRSLKELAEYADKFGSVLAVEDLPRTCLGNCSKELLDLISVDSRLRVTFDVNHLLKETHREFVHAVGKYIVNTHFSDYDFIDERHWMPGEGDINWVELMDLLDEAGYEGAINYEINRDKEARFLTRERKIEYTDIKKNHASLESRSPIETFCTRLPV